jgi:hypothetical protein
MSDQDSRASVSVGAAVKLCFVEVIDCSYFATFRLFMSAHCFAGSENNSASAFMMLS